MPEQNIKYILRLSNGPLMHRSRPLEKETTSAGEVAKMYDCSVTLSRAEIYQILAKGKIEIAEQSCEGDLTALQNILELCGVQTSTKDAGTRQGKL